MFEKVLKTPEQLARFRNGPLAEERSCYLEHLCDEGRSFSRLAAINTRLLSIAEMIGQDRVRRYNSAELNDLAEQWFDALPAAKKPSCDRIAKLDFQFLASGWLRFMGRLNEPQATGPYEMKSASFWPIWSTTAATRRPPVETGNAR